MLVREAVGGGVGELIGGEVGCFVGTIVGKENGEIVGGGVGADVGGAVVGEMLANHDNNAIWARCALYSLRAFLRVATFQTANRTAALCHLGNG